MNNTIKDAVYLIDDISLMSWPGLASGWDFVIDGEGPEHYNNTRHHLLLNSDKDGETYLKRDCRSFEGGIMTFEAHVTNISGSGLYFKIGSRKEAFFELHTQGEVLYTQNSGVCGFDYGLHHIEAKLDMIRSKAILYVDKKFRGEFDFCTDAFAVSCVRIGYGYSDRGSAIIHYTKLYVNYLVNDYCRSELTGEMPDVYSVYSKGAKAEVDRRVKDKGDTAYFIKALKGQEARVVRSFDKASGCVAFEIKYHTAAKNGRVKISLKNGSSDLLSLYDDGDALMHENTLLRAHHTNVWQTLRIEADTRTCKALVWLNGKKTKVICFDSNECFADNFEFSYDANKKSEAMFCDILVWEKPDEPEDYVPVPIIPKKKDNLVVGMNICSLWREGTHFGWDTITPYDDVTPVLGYYEEGLPETADWEIKFLAEHGIDYELYCWYSSESQAPLKSTGLSYAIHQGHFHAKYADNMKLALLWEAANCAHPTGLDSFKKYLVPYWIDYFFSDPRYMSIDNKAIMSCFGVNCVERDLGGEENVREGLQYLRDEVKKLGFDDLIVMGCHANPGDLKRLGFDAFHAYHWGPEGYKLQTNIDRNNDYVNMDKVHIVPTVSVGFKNVGWGGNRRPNLSAEDMYNGLEYCKKELLPKFEKNTWKSRTLHLSTWNEYGEGTYMMPSGLNGFGYLDAVRRAVCQDVPHTDVVPTEAQKARISYLRAPGRVKLRRTKYDTRPLPKTDTLVAKYEFKTDKDLEKWEFRNIDEYKIENDVLCGKTSQNESTMMLKGCKLDASKIAYVKLTMKNKYIGQGSRHLRFNYAKTASEFNGSFATNLWAMSPEMATYTIELDNNARWTDTIDAFCVTPIIIPGEFEVQSVEFFAGVPHMTLYSPCGKQLFFGDYLEERDGSYTIPLDPESGILDGCSYEWLKDKETLEISKGEDKYIVTVGKAYVTKNSQNITLLRPVYYKDGIPSLLLCDYEKVFGVKSEIKEEKIYLK